MIVACGVESATRGQQAVESRQKLLDARVWRNGREVKHALEVAQSHKENYKLAAQAKGEKLAEKLEAAESRRQEAIQSSIQFAANHDGRARNFAIARQEQVMPPLSECTPLHCCLHPCPTALFGSLSLS